MKFVFLFISTLASAAPYQCDYRDNLFIVKDGEKSYEQKVQKNFYNFSLGCADGLAGMYDGDDFTVFDGKEKRFEYKNIRNNFDFSQAAASGQHVAVYDGESFHVYDGATSRFYSQAANKDFRTAKLDSGEGVAAMYDGAKFLVFAGGKFQSETVRARFQHSRLSAGGNIALLYDGDSFQVYDAKEGFTHRSAKHGFLFARTLATPAGAIGYDGDEVVGYCPEGGQIISADAENEAFTQAEYDTAKKEVRLQVNKTWYRLDSASCRLIRG